MGPHRPEGDGSEQAIGRLLCATVLALTLLVAVVPGVPAAGSVGPTVSVTARTGLHDGDRVTVAGVGWVPGRPLEVRECTGDGRSCIVLRGFPIAGDRGRFSVHTRVVLAFQSPSGTVVDCRVDRCVVVAQQGSDRRAVSARLRFASTAQPLLALTPSTDLVDGQTVIVTGRHLPPRRSRLTLDLCRARECYPSTTRVEVATDADGTFQVPLTVAATFQWLDCRLRACSLELNQQGSSGLARLATVPVAFRPDGPLAYQPTLTVEPAGPYADGQAVTVVGQGWEPGSEVRIVHCELESAADPTCPTDFPWPPPTADAVGAFRVDVTLSASALRRTGGRSDCRDDHCELRAASDRYRARLPLTFDPGLPLLPTPTLALNLNEDLLVGQVVHATGEGFEPERSYHIGQCRSGAYLDPVPCLAGDVTADADGTIEFDWTVAGSIYAYHDDYTICLGAGRCFLDVADDSWRALASAPLNLRAEGDEVVSVAPRAGLDDDEQVTVDATGLNPGLAVDLAQCTVRSRALPRSYCTRMRTAIVGPSGALHRTFRVRSTFRPEHDPGHPVDCRRETCVVLVGGPAVTYQPDYYGRHYHYRAIRLSFVEGRSPAAPPPAVTESRPATPSTSAPTTTTLPGTATTAAIPVPGH